MICQYTSHSCGKLYHYDPNLNFIFHQGSDFVKCDTANDLVILLDSSASVEEEGFELAKTFAKELASRFTMSPEKTHASIIGFSHYVKILMKFKDLYSNDQVKQAVNNMTFEGSTTATTKAIKAAQFEVFSKKGGARIRRPG